MEVIDFSNSDEHKKEVADLVRKLNNVCDGCDKVVVLDALLSLLALGLNETVLEHNGLDVVLSMTNQDLRAKLEKIQGGKSDDNKKV